MSGFNVAVVGATGQVGRVMRTLLEERGFPVETVDLGDDERDLGVLAPRGGVVDDDRADGRLLRH